MGAYLGRFRVGESVPLRLDLPQWPDEPPEASIILGGITLAVVPLAASGPPEGSFTQPLRLAQGYGEGTYTVAYAFTLEGAACLDLDRFEVVGGGDSAGRLVSMHALDRPEARFVVGQLASGRLNYGRDPGT